MYMPWCKVSGAHCSLRDAAAIPAAAAAVHRPLLFAINNSPLLTSRHRCVSITARASGGGGGQGERRRSDSGGRAGGRGGRGSGGGRGGRGGRGGGRSGGRGGGRGGSTSTAKKGGPAAPPPDFEVIGRAGPRYMAGGSSDGGGGDGSSSGTATATAPVEGGIDPQDGASVWAMQWRAEFGFDPDEDEEEDDTDEGEGGDEFGGGAAAGGRSEAAAEANFRAIVDGLLGDLEEADEPPARAEWRAVYTSRALPAPRLGAATPGHSSAPKGRGLFAARDVEEGELLLVSGAVGVLYCEQGSTPENEELADYLAGGGCALTAAQVEALRLLRPAGVSGDGAAAPLPTAAQMLCDSDAAAAEAAASSTPRQQQQQQQQQQQHLPPTDALYALVNANCTGEEYEDPVLCALRGARGAGHIGVWPGAAYANHSCAPNAVGYAIGDRWVLRAAAPLTAGDEIEVSYLGSLIAAPRALRRAELREKFAFDCACARCAAEEAAGPRVLELQEAAHAECESELGPALDAAIVSGDTDSAARVAARLRELRDEYEAAYKASKAPAKARRWLQASAFAVYDLLSLAADELADTADGGGGGGSSSGSSGGGPGGALPETEALAECARVSGAAFRGSAEHFELAVEYAARAEARFGPSHQEATAAARAARAAARARYGPAVDVGDALVDLLVDARAALGDE